MWYIDDFMTFVADEMKMQIIPVVKTHSAAVNSYGRNLTALRGGSKVSVYRCFAYRRMHFYYIRVYVFCRRVVCQMVYRVEYHLTLHSFSFQSKSPFSIDIYYYIIIFIVYQVTYFNIT